MNEIIQDYILDRFQEEAEKVDVEVCGLIIQNTKDRVQHLYMIDNISDYQKEVDYVMHPQQAYDVLKDTTIIDKNSKYKLLSVIHSHPNGIQNPSIVDIRRKAYNVCYTIYSKVTKQFGFWDLDKEDETYDDWGFQLDISKEINEIVKENKLGDE